MNKYIKKPDSFKDKTTTFLVSTFIVKEHEHNYFHYLLAIISELQILALLLHFSEHFLEDEQETHIDFLNPVIELLMCGKIIDIEITPEFNGGNVLTLIIVYYFTIFITLITTLVAYKFQYHGLRKKGNYMLANFAYLGQQVLFLPIFGSLIRLIFDYNRGQMQLYDTVQSSLGLGAVITLLLIHTIYSLISSIFNLNPFHNENLLGCKSSWGYSLNTIHKIILIILFGQDPISLTQWVHILSSLVLTGAKIMEITPFYNYLTLKIRCGFLAIQTSAVILNLMAGFWPENLKSILYLIFVLAIPVYILLFKYLDLVLFGPVNCHYSKSLIQNHEEIFHKYIGLCHVLKNGVMFNTETIKAKTREEIYYLGLLTAHAKDCKDLKCFCKFHTVADSVGLNSRKFNRSIERFNYELRKQFFEERFKHKSHQNWMRILYCQLILETQPDQYLTAMWILSGINKHSATLIEKFMIDDLNHRISFMIEMMYSSEKIDAKTFLKFQKYLKKFNTLILATCKSMINFWDHFHQMQPRLSTLISLSGESEQNSKKVLKVWRQMRENCHYFSIDQSLTMAIYFSLLRNSNIASQEIIKERNRIIFKYYSEFDTISNLTDKTILDPRNIIIRMSMSQNSIGIVLSITKNVEFYYGWKPTNLIGRTLDPIIPKFFREKHQALLIDQLQTGRTSRFNTNISVFGEDSEGYSVPQRIYLSPFPDPKYEFSYMGILRPCFDVSEKIVLLENGKIGGITRNIARELKISPASLDEYNLFELCPSLEKYHKIIKL